ncbi:PIG-L family deacetylase [Paenactinomyces guangxiensis]|uniref:PIG-L family deacetylase n=1 Tax=Paenactinomyces guangxiensis TaxID=1490290 RepID=A0A7W1WRJ5_9BACL|nr:PIG-L family deacetylase [Paenactinomyces guangxiensis]MBA4494561.1 PIG-L family deacetylase [Paenactinomyces guangxiensis]MBH8591676.1 PIG-L family deacetylase [Paenactinomyces guangxiensis]
MDKTWLKKLAVVFLTAALFIGTLLPGSLVYGEPEADPELWKVLQPLGTTVSFMNTGAHPDDEQSALLAYLSLGKGVRTASVLANRGEGGQNEIGTELGNGLGIIRSRELQEAANLLNVNLFLLSEKINDPIYDFGFSKSPEETLDKWGEQIVYERLIRRIRTERPDLVMPSFRDDPSQHGHHRAISQLTLRAFKDAADPRVFPEHLRQGIKPWQVKKVYLPAAKDKETLRFNIGTVDPVYGLTYPQLGEESRKLHKSQGMGRDLPVEDYWVSLELVHSSVGKVKQESTIFEDIPYNFRDQSKQISHPAVKQRLITLQEHLEQAQKAYPDRKKAAFLIQRSLKETSEMERLVASVLPKEQQQDLLFLLQKKEEQLEKASAVTGGVEVQMSADQAILTRGATSRFTIQMNHNGHAPITQIKVKPVVPKNWQAKMERYPPTLLPGKKGTITIQVRTPADASFFDPYAPSRVRAELQYRLHGVTVKRIVTLDPKRQTMALLPDWGLLLNPEATIINTEKSDKTRKISVQVTNYVRGESSGVVTPSLPASWKAVPSSIPVSFARQGESKQLQFTITAPDSLQARAYEIGFQAVVNGQSFSAQVQKIHYNHIGTSYLITDAKTTIQAFPLKLANNLNIAYVDSGFDQVADYLRQAGLNVTELNEQMLSSGDLSQYNTIVVGIRAYLSRSDLLKHNDRLLEYVRNGGNVVMQYHKPGDRWSPELAPYPLTPGDPSIQWRVTDEHAPVTFLQPDHPLLQAPNQISAEDFSGWVQERGLYFPSSWDPAYTPLLSMADPGEKPFTGGLLVADYGKGTYIYSSLVWYRQIQSQVPGGYRMFVNLISYPKTK